MAFKNLCLCLHQTYHFIYLAEKAQKQIKKNPIAGLILQEVP
jgi:hypothetical protein